MRCIPQFIRTIAATTLALIGIGLRGQTTLQAVNEFDGLMRGYNAIALGNASFSQGDSYGAIAVGGNLTVSGWEVAQKSYLYPTMTSPSLYVNGNLVVNGSSKLMSGYASTPNVTGSWTFTATNQRLFQGGTGGGTLTSENSSESTYSYHDPRTNPVPSGWNWAAIESTTTSLSDTLAAAAATGLVAITNNTLTFSSPNADAGVVVFNLNAATLGSFSNFQFNVGTDQTYVINVLNASGRNLFSGGSNFDSSDLNVASQLLWNFVGTGTVTLSNGGDFAGSILAPGMTINDSATAITGQVLAGGLNISSVELHYSGFTPTALPPAVLVPEPGTYALAAVAVCGAGLVWRRRRMTVRRGE